MSCIICPHFLNLSICWQSLMYFTADVSFVMCALPTARKNSDFVESLKFTWKIRFNSVERGRQGHYSFIKAKTASWGRGCQEIFLNFLLNFAHIYHIFPQTLPPSFITFPSPACVSSLKFFQFFIMFSSIFYADFWQIFLKYFSNFFQTVQTPTPGIHIVRQTF